MRPLSVASADDSALIHIAHSVKNISVAFHISLCLLNYSSIHFSAWQSFCKSPFTNQAHVLCQHGWQQISSVSGELDDGLCQLRLLPVVKRRLPSFFLFASGEKVSSLGSVYQMAACWATYLWNVEELHIYLSRSLHLLELATSHFR